MTIEQVEYDLKGKEYHVEANGGVTIIKRPAIE